MIGNLLQVVQRLNPKVNYAIKPTLVSIGFSHFCERSRWMLDLSPLQYQEEMHAPAMHLSSTLLNLSKYPRFQPSTSHHTSNVMESLLSKDPTADSKLIRRKEKTAVPKLVVSSTHFQKTIANLSSSMHIVQDGSNGIAHFLQQTYGDELHYLYPPQLTKEIVELETYITRELAPAVTTFLFGCMLLPTINGVDNTEASKFFLRKCIQSDISMIQKVILKLLGQSFIVPTMVKNNGISEENIHTAKEKILEVYAHIDQRYGGKGKKDTVLLFDTERPTAADITLAAISFPIMLPPQTAKLFSSMEDIESLRAVGAKEFLNVHKTVKEKSVSARNTLAVYERFRSSP